MPYYEYHGGGGGGSGSDTYYGIPYRAVGLYLIYDLFLITLMTIKPKDIHNISLSKLFIFKKRY